MNGFYVSMIFLGIIFIVASLAFIMIDKRSTAGLLKKMEEKNRDITEIINDAEQMTEELNKFSDYIITRIDEKNQELQESLRLADDSIQRLEACNIGCSGQDKAYSLSKADEVFVDDAGTEVITGASVVTASSDTIVKAAGKAEAASKTEAVSKVEAAIKTEAASKTQAAIKTEVVSKVEAMGKQGTGSMDNIPSGQKQASKQETVVKLHNDGLSETEIARVLNMGKGEIQLILELNK